MECGSEYSKKRRKKICGEMNLFQHIFSLRILKIQDKTYKMQGMQGFYKTYPNAKMQDSNNPGFSIARNIEDSESSLVHYLRAEGELTGLVPLL